MKKIYYGHTLAPIKPGDCVRFPLHVKLQVALNLIFSLPSEAMGRQRLMQ